MAIFPDAPLAAGTDKETMFHLVPVLPSVTMADIFTGPVASALGVHIISSLV